MHPRQCHQSILHALRVPSTAKATEGDVAPFLSGLQLRSEFLLSVRPVPADRRQDGRAER